MKTQPTPLPPVLFEDDYLIAFDKPSGLIMAPDPREKDKLSLVNLIRQHRYSGIVNAHLIDTETSGIVLCAKTKPVLTALKKQWKFSEGVTHYRVLVIHAPPENEMEITNSIEPDPERPGAMKIGGGKRGLARTRLRVMERWRGYSLLAVVPETGKTHQIRVHLAHIGCPVLADPLYGHAMGLKLSAIKPRYKFKDTEEYPLLNRLALHTESLVFTHPITKVPQTLHAPLPGDFTIAIKYLKRFAGVGFRPDSAMD